MWPQLVRLDGPASPFIANVTNPLDKHATLANRAACLISIGVGVGGKPGELNLEPACLVARVSDRIAGRIAEAPDKPWFRQRLCDVLRHPGVSRRDMRSASRNSATSHSRWRPRKRNEPIRRAQSGRACERVPICRSAPSSPRSYPVSPPLNATVLTVWSQPRSASFRRSKSSPIGIPPRASSSHPLIHRHAASCAIRPARAPW